MASGEIAVVGAGPAGLMAASVLADAGRRVTVFEAHRSPGRKFVLAGRSGLNLTHSEGPDDLLRRYGANRHFLQTAIGRFDSSHVRSWADRLGAETFVGSSGRVFPAAMSATPLLRAWLHDLAKTNVTLETGHRWTGWTDDGSALTFGTRDGEVTHPCVAVVLALGGASWPNVSSDGNWATLLAERGIKMVDFQPSNCGVEVAWSDVLKERFLGTPVKNVAVGVRDGGEVSRELVRGDIVITDKGLEGGPIYANSRALRAVLSAADRPALTIDLVPDLTTDALAARLANRRAKSTTTSWLRSAGLSPQAIALWREAAGNNLPIDYADAARAAKSIALSIDGLSSMDRAISSVGGVALPEVDDRFMLARLPGVFVAGEMLDWDAPTGGYLLQACFSTGVAAASGALSWLGLSE